MSLDISFKRDLEQIKDEHKDNSYASKIQKLKKIAKEIILSSPKFEKEIIDILSSGLHIDKKMELLEKYKKIAEIKEPKIDDILERINAQLDVIDSGKRRR